jgi:hypothetical protein
MKAHERPFCNPHETLAAVANLGIAMALLPLLGIGATPSGQDPAVPPFWLRQTTLTGNEQTWNCVLFSTDGSSLELLLLTGTVLVPPWIVATAKFDHETGNPGEEHRT